MHDPVAQEGFLRTSLRFGVTISWRKVLDDTHGWGYCAHELSSDHSEQFQQIFGQAKADIGFA